MSATSYAGRGGHRHANTSFACPIQYQNYYYHSISISIIMIIVKGLLAGGDPQIRGQRAQNLLAAHLTNIVRS